MGRRKPIPVLTALLLGVCPHFKLDRTEFTLPEMVFLYQRYVDVHGKFSTIYNRKILGEGDPMWELERSANPNFRRVRVADMMLHFSTPCNE